MEGRKDEQRGNAKEQKLFIHKKTVNSVDNKK
jgi:hypothetical protein